MTRITIDTGSGMCSLEFDARTVWIEADGHRARIEGPSAEALAASAIAFLEMLKAQAEIVLARGSA
jgi:hypothetical protein